MPSRTYITPTIRDELFTATSARSFSASLAKGCFSNSGAEKPPRSVAASGRSGHAADARRATAGVFGMDVREAGFHRYLPRNKKPHSGNPARGHEKGPAGDSQRADRKLAHHVVTGIQSARHIRCLYRRMWHRGACVLPHAPHTLSKCEVSVPSAVTSSLLELVGLRSVQRCLTGAPQ